MKQDRQEPTKDKKPKKPYPDFPLFPHATKRWAKKIKGKLHYFGPWDDPDGALEKYVRDKDALHAGRKPRQVSEAGVSIRDLLNKFLTSKKHLLDSGEITQRTFSDYFAACERIKAEFGLTRPVADLDADDFETFRSNMAKKWGPVTLANEIQRIRVVFKYAFDQGLIDHPVRYGQGFKRPSKKNLRKHRNAGEKKLFAAEEIRRLLEEASLQMKAMILLGINCGFGNTDCGTLPQSALDLDGGWIDFPRPKTGIVRRCPIWPETVEALRAALAKRPKPKDDTDAGLVFITRYGQPWAKDKLPLGKSEAETDETKERSESEDEDEAPTVSDPESHEEVAARKRALIDSPITKEMNKLTRALGIQRKGVSFYALRHTFETIGGESRDQVAVDAIMGHAKEDMASVYREGISDERLRDVVDVVHKWLFAEPEQPQKPTKRQTRKPLSKKKPTGKPKASTSRKAKG